MSKIQSVIFDKELFDLKKAVNWLYANNLKFKKADIKQNTIRFRQLEPSALRKEGYNHYAMKDITNGIKFVLAFA